jgi:hypothetical protein
MWMRLLLLLLLTLLLSISSLRRCCQQAVGSSWHMLLLPPHLPRLLLLLLLLLQLMQVEQEAKYDVKDRTGRRYRKAEQGVIWMLLVSCAIAISEISKKVLGDDSLSSSGSSPSGAHLSNFDETASPTADVEGLLNSFQQVLGPPYVDNNMMEEQQQQ